MTAIHTKPRLVFFQYKYDESLPEFLLYQKEEHVKCLRYFFDVTVINEDCDYQQICDLIEPDLVLVESGVSYPSCKRPKITNTRANSRVPKVGLMNSDAFCKTRAGFLSDMAHWGIDIAFSISTRAAEYNIDIAHNLFVWPVFVDDEAYHDYHQWKSIPVLFTGNTNSLYPWRQRMINIVPKHYPCLISPHPGYTPRHKSSTPAVRVMAGERYARMLNSSQFVAACGTIAKEVVRKHFEIPASKACLLTEKSDMLEAAGFADMINCVFADEHDVLDKLEYLFSHPEKLSAITDAGHQLVKLRHTSQQRNQIRQWFDLWRVRLPGQQITQPSPFEDLRITESASGSRACHSASPNEHLKLLREGDEKLGAGDYDQAMQLYTRCWSYIPWMPEPQLKIALCNLYKGNSKAALSWISEPLRFTLSEYEADEPDPVEWAYFIVILICQGRLTEAVRRSGEFRELRHPHLDRVRNAVRVLCEDTAFVDNSSSHYRASIHNVPVGRLVEWIDQLCKILSACGKRALSDKLLQIIREGRLEQMSGGNDGTAKRSLSELDSNSGVSSVGYKGASWKTKFLLGYKGSFTSASRQKCKRIAASVLHRWESHHGYRLPYRMSAARTDEFYGFISELVQRVDIRSVVLIGANQRMYITMALLTGLRRKKGSASVLCISESSGICERFGESTVQWLCPNRARSSHSHTGGDPLLSAISTFKQTNSIDSFDLVVIDASELTCELSGIVTEAVEWQSAKFIAIDHTEKMGEYCDYHSLACKSWHVLALCAPGSRRGYAVYEKHQRAVYAIAESHDRRCLSDVNN
jgi:hypothetical protein